MKRSFAQNAWYPPCHLYQTSTCSSEQWPSWTCWQQDWYTRHWMWQKSEYPLLSLQMERDVFSAESIKEGSLSPSSSSSLQFRFHLLLFLTYIFIVFALLFSIFLISHMYYLFSHIMFLTEQSVSKIKWMGIHLGCINLGLVVYLVASALTWTSKADGDTSEGVVKLVRSR